MAKAEPLMRTLLTGFSAQARGRVQYASRFSQLPCADLDQARRERERSAAIAIFISFPSSYTVRLTLALWSPRALRCGRPAEAS